MRASKQDTYVHSFTHPRYPWSYPLFLIFTWVVFLCLWDGWLAYPVYVYRYFCLCSVAMLGDIYVCQIYIRCSLWQMRFTATMLFSYKTAVLIASLDVLPRTSRWFVSNVRGWAYRYCYGYSTVSVRCLDKWTTIDIDIGWYSLGLVWILVMDTLFMFYQ